MEMVTKIDSHLLEGVWCVIKLISRCFLSNVEGNA